MTDEPKNFRVTSHQAIYNGKVFNVLVDSIEYDSGIKGVREVVQHPGGAAVVGLFPDGTVLLVRQYRYPLNAWLWEIPAGKLDREEDPLDAARREFREETGYQAESIRLLMRIHTTPGFCDETLYLYIAKGLTPDPRGQQLEEGEHTLTVHRLPLDDVIGMIEKGEITDSKTICAILFTAQTLR